MIQAEVIADISRQMTAAESRIYNQVVPENVSLPFVATQQIAYSRPKVLSGAGLLTRVTVRLAIFANKALEAEQIAQAIRRRYQGFSGQLGLIRVQSTQVESSPEEVAFVDGDKTVKGTGVDLFFVFSEEI
jgi:hypothetical protein